MLKPLIVIVIIISLVLFVSEVILGQFFSIHLIGTTGQVKVMDVGVYWDANCTSPVYFLDWGNVEPGLFKNITFFVRNEGNEPSTLFLNATNWNPPTASDFMTLSWDYNGHLLYVNEVTEVTLTLSISTGIEGISGFSFDIIIGISV